MADERAFTLHFRRCPVCGRPTHRNPCEQCGVTVLQWWVDGVPQTRTITTSDEWAQLFEWPDEIGEVGQ